LGEIIFDHPFTSYDKPQTSRCGTCTRCLDTCPTGALAEAYTLDAARCLSYLTIEYHGDTLPAEAARAMGNCVYGCDRCQQACPWMRFARPTDVAEFRPKPEFLRLDHAALQSLSIEDYRRIFRGSAIKRAKYEGLMRNVKAAGEKV
ncbi:MAG: tRNA epoxyqueuosine(34) reductase QueG, partial [Bacteroidaceae bacterium]|nr:tRNA epoxyqueuosine(34) reductase QueG [Bacteroidaceae bacterium]